MTVYTVGEVRHEMTGQIIITSHWGHANSLPMLTYSFLINVQSFI